MSQKDIVEYALGQFLEHEETSTYACSWGYNWNKEHAQYDLMLYYRHRELPVPARCLLEDMGGDLCRLHCHATVSLCSPIATLKEVAWLLSLRNGARKVTWILDNQGYRASVLPYPATATTWLMTNAGGVALRTSADCYPNTPLTDLFRTIFHELTDEFALVTPVIRKVLRREWTANQAIQQIQAEETAVGR